LPTPDINLRALFIGYQDQLRRLLEAHVTFSRIPELWTPASPALFIGAVNVCSGHFRVFKNTEITVESVLASAAVPPVFPAVEVDGELYWDGLMSQNPPIRDLSWLQPDELWLIQLNPRRWSRRPVAMGEIIDRQNELIENLSLEQEVQFIQQLNEFIRTGQLVNPDLREITIRRIEMTRHLDYASKTQRSPAFIADMMAYGEQQAEEFLHQLESKT
jgi:NTE family protein